MPNTAWPSLQGIYEPEEEEDRWPSLSGLMFDAPVVEQPQGNRNAGLEFQESALRGKPAAMAAPIPGDREAEFDPAMLKAARNYLGEDAAMREERKSGEWFDFRSIPPERRDEFMQTLDYAAKTKVPDQVFDPVASLSTGVKTVAEMPQQVARAMGMLSPEETAELEFYNKLEGVKRSSARAERPKFEEGDSLVTKGGKLAREGLLGALEMAPAMYAGGQVGKLGGAVAGAIGMSAPKVAAVATGTGTAFWSATEFPELYDSAREMGVDEGKARIGALVAAPLVGYVESLQFGQLEAPLKRMFKDKVQQSALKYAAETAKTLGATYVTEVTEENIQNGIGVAMRGALAAMDEDVKMNGNKELQQAFDTNRGAMLSMPFMLGPGASAKVASDAMSATSSPAAAKWRGGGSATEAVTGEDPAMRRMGDRAEADFVDKRAVRNAEVDAAARAWAEQHGDPASVAAVGQLAEPDKPVSREAFKASAASAVEIGGRKLSQDDRTAFARSVRAWMGETEDAGPIQSAERPDDPIVPSEIPQGEANVGPIERVPGSDGGRVVEAEPAEQLPGRLDPGRGREAEPGATGVGGQQDTPPDPLTRLRELDPVAAEAVVEENVSPELIAGANRVIEAKRRVQSQGVEDANDRRADSGAGLEGLSGIREEQDRQESGGDREADGAEREPIPAERGAVDVPGLADDAISGQQPEAIRPVRTGEQPVPRPGILRRSTARAEDAVDASGEMVGGRQQVPEVLEAAGGELQSEGTQAPSEATPVPPQPVGETAVEQSKQPFRARRAGDNITIKTVGGRDIPAPPMIRTDTNRKATADVKKVDQWLIDQAVAEAQSRGDDFNLLQFQNEKANNLPPASKAGMSMYLFGEEFPEFDAKTGQQIGKKPQATVPDGDTTRTVEGTDAPVVEPQPFRAKRKLGEPINAGEPVDIAGGATLPRATEGTAPAVEQKRPLYRETNLDGLSEMLGDTSGGHTFGPPDVFFTDTPELAIGQGANRGVVVEVDREGLDLKEHKKPGTEIPGVGKEFKVRANPSSLKDKIVAVTVKPGGDKAMGIRMRRWFDRNSWPSEQTEAGTVYKNPSVAQQQEPNVEPTPNRQSIAPPEPTAVSAPPVGTPAEKGRRIGKASVPATAPVVGEEAAAPVAPILKRNPETPNAPTETSLPVSATPKIEAVQPTVVAEETAVQEAGESKRVRPWESLSEASDTVDGRTVRKDIPNTASIDSTLDSYTEMPGVRDVPIEAFEDSAPPVFHSASEEKRTRKLADEIAASKEINPLIVVYDKDGPYVLEGGHRFDALKLLGAKSFPAKVVLDDESIASVEEAAETTRPSERVEAPAEDTPEPPARPERIADLPIQPVRVAEVKLDPDRFQFKSGTNSTGVVAGEQLQGEYNPIAAGSVLLWEDKAGQKFAVNGHHRTELAKRTGRETMNAQIVRETDGVSAEQAKALGAELNILEGQGKVEDYANFFKETNISETAAESRGLLARNKGKTGFVVGKFASDDTWAAFRGGKVTVEKAAAIADIGRGDDGLQSLGLTRAKTLNADELRSTLHAFKLFPRSTTGKQADLFGFDDSAIVEAEQIGRAAVEIINEKKERVLAVQGTLKRPAVARKMGLSGDTEKIQTEVNVLRGELDDWHSWYTKPELVGQARQRAGLSVEAPSVAPPAPTATSAQTAIPGFEAAAANVQRTEQGKQSKQKFSSVKGKQATFLSGLGKDLPGQTVMFDDIDGLNERSLSDEASKPAKTLPQAIANKFMDSDEMEAKEAAANEEYERNRDGEIEKAAKLVLDPPGTVLASLMYQGEELDSTDEGIHNVTSKQGKAYSFDAHNYKLPDGRIRVLLSAGDHKNLVDAGALIKPTKDGVIVQTIHKGETGFSNLGGVLLKYINQKHGQIVADDDAPLSADGRRAIELLNRKSQANPVDSTVEEVEAATPEVAEPTVSPVAPKAGKKGDERAGTPLAPGSAESSSKTPGKPQTEGGTALVKKIQTDIAKGTRKSGMRSINTFLAEAFGGQLFMTNRNTSRRHPALFRRHVAAILSRTPSSTLNVHEAGHAMSSWIQDEAPKWMESHKELLTNFGKRQMTNGASSAPTAEEGIAEFVRLYVTKPSDLPANVRDAMVELLTASSPIALKTLDDAKVAYDLHTGRELTEQQIADARDIEKAADGERTAEWYWMTLHNLIGKSPLFHRFKSRIWNGITETNTLLVADKTGVLAVGKEVADKAFREKSRQARRVMKELHDTPMDSDRAYANLVRSPVAAMQAMSDMQDGHGGIRVYVRGKGKGKGIAKNQAIDKKQWERLRTAFPSLQEQVPLDGDEVLLFAKTYDSIKQQVGEDNWLDFVQNVRNRTSVERYRAEGHRYPGIERHSPETLERSYEAAFKANPGWNDSYSDLRGFMDSLLVIEALGGRRTVDEAITMATKWEWYSPLQRQVEKQGGGRGAFDIDPEFGSFGAKGSEKEYRDMDLNVHQRVTQAFDAYYQNELIGAVDDSLRMIADDKGIDYNTRTALARTMIPMNMELKPVANVTDEEQRQIIADGVNRTMLAEMGIDSEELSPKQVAATLEKEGADVMAPEDIQFMMPGKPIFRAQKPKGQVATRWVNGSPQYLWITDPVTFTMLSAVEKPRVTVRLFERLFKGLADPWKRNITQTLSFSIRNLPRDSTTAILLNEDNLVPGAYAAIALAERIRGSELSKEARAPSELLSKALDVTTTKAHKSTVENFKAVLAEGVVVPGFWGLSTVEKMAVAPGVGMAVGLKPWDLFNYATGQRALSEELESATREGAYIAERKKGGTKAKAREQYDKSSGFFAQRQGSPTLRSILKVAGFANPAIQISYQMYESFSHPDPKMRSHQALFKAPYIAGLGAALAAGSMALLRAMHQDDDEYEAAINAIMDTPETERLGHAHIGGVLRMPFDHGPAGALMSMGYNTTLDYLADAPNDVERQKRIMRLVSRGLQLPISGGADIAGISEDAREATEIFVLPVPPHAKTAGELLWNHSLHWNKDIVPEYMMTNENMEPWERDFWSTPDLYKKLGKATNTSPLKWQYATRNLLSSSVDETIKGIDKWKKGSATWKDIPTLRPLLVQPSTGRQSRGVQAIEETQKQYKAALRTIEYNLGNMEGDDYKAAMDKVLELSTLQAASREVERLEKKMSDIRRQDKPDYEKIKQLESEMTTVARQAASGRYSAESSLDELPDELRDATRKYMADLKELGSGMTKEPSPSDGIDNRTPLGKPQKQTAGTKAEFDQRTKEYNEKRLGAKEVYKGLMKRK